MRELLGKIRTLASMGEYPAALRLTIKLDAELRARVRTAFKEATNSHDLDRRLSEVTI